MNTTPCAHVKADGAHCRSVIGISPTSGLCPVHDPASRERMRRTRAKGGRATRKGPIVVDRADAPPAPQSLDDAVAFASWLTHAVVIGKIDARTAHESGYCLTQFTSAAKQRDLERRVKELLRQIDEMKKAGGRVA